MVVIFHRYFEMIPVILYPVLLLKMSSSFLFFYMQPVFYLLLEFFFHILKFQSISMWKWDFSYSFLVLFSPLNLRSVFFFHSGELISIIFSNISSHHSTPPHYLSCLLSEYQHFLFLFLYCPKIFFPLRCFLKYGFPIIYSLPSYTISIFHLLYFLLYCMFHT